jgi:cobaltochelatase CobT
MSERHPSIHPSETGFQRLTETKRPDFLSEYTEEQFQEMENKRQILSSLAFFIGKDFKIPVEYNQPGQGWHWDFAKNIIRIDPKDLLEKPMDYLRFVISHEGGHRRVSRADFIPEEVWVQPGFSFMMNSIEDPRDNNFVAEVYPKFGEQMETAYEQDLDFEHKAKEKAKDKLGFQPRFMQAGFEYIKQWFRERKNQPFAIGDDLPTEVKEAVEKTLPSAVDSWWRYPSRSEADQSEELIIKYAKVSYDINLKKIWPEFKKLVDEDKKDSRVQEIMKEMQTQKGQGAPDGAPIPPELKDKLTPEEQKQLEEAIEQAMKGGKKEKGEKGAGTESEGETGVGKKKEGEPTAGGRPIDMDSLSDELKKKLKEYFDSLPEETKKGLAEKAEAELKELEKYLDEEMSGKLIEDPEKRAEREKIEAKQAKESKPEAQPAKKTPGKERGILPADFSESRKKMDRAMERRKNESNQYERIMPECAPLIDALSGDLRDVFIKRKLHKYSTGHRFGRRWNVRKRIQERIAGIPLIRTEAREQRESKSEEKDYAITLMADLSGSMRGKKIRETFKSAVILSEVLNDLNVKFEVVGFQDILLEFKKFDDHLSDDMRAKLNGLLQEVENSHPGGHNNSGDNNDGECLMSAASNLTRQNAKNKFLIVLSDGVPAMDSGRKSRDTLDKELKNAVNYVENSTDIKLIGIGLLSNAVANYYTNNMPNVSAEEMSETLGELIKEIISKY